MMTLDEVRFAVAVLLANSDDNEYDDNPSRTYCRECRWDSRRDQPLSNEPHCLHKRGCKLSAARRLLETFVEDAEISEDDDADREPAQAVDAVDEAAASSAQQADEAVHKMLSVMSLYSGYEVRTRGPLGLLLDAIQDLRPEVREFLEASCDHGNCNTMSDAAGDATKCFFPQAEDDQWPLAVGVDFAAAANVPNILVSMKGGVSLGVPLSRYPKLEAATPGARRSFQIKAGGAVIHWPDLDETIFVASLFIYPWPKAEKAPENA